MNENESPTRNSKTSYTHSKSLKESLHYKSIKYVDLFCILWLILHKKLKIYNIKSYKMLIDGLNVVCVNNNSNSDKFRAVLLDYINNSSFNHIIARFISNIENKFNFIKRKHNSFEHLSYNDFETCTIVLGREPFGLYSTMKKCMCRFNSNREEDIDFKVELNKVTGKWKDLEVFECKKCLNGDDLLPLVGVVTPFVLTSHEEYLENQGTRQKKRKISEDFYKYGDSYKVNEKLYSSSNYPLQCVFDTSEDWVYGKDGQYEQQSHHLSDMLFELVCVMLEDKSNLDVSEEAYKLGLIIKEHLNRDIGDEEYDNYDKGHEDSDVMFDERVMDKIVNEYRGPLEKVTKLKPFPTMYWLIDKNLINKVSKLESEGIIKDIQKYIDEKIEDYDKNSKGDDDKGDTINNNKDDDSNTTDEESFIKILIEDNLSYMIRKYQLMHPKLVELLYNIIFNSNMFTVNIEEESVTDKSKYIRLECRKEGKNKSREVEILHKVLSILNTIRIHGIGGSKDFLHIKCLHTNLAYEIGEGSYIGNLVSKII